jgi:hypothetical protein
VTDPGPARAPIDVLAKVRSIKGTTLIVVINVILAAVFAVNFVAARRNNAEEKMRREDATALHNPAMTVETWKPLKDGMELTVLPVDASDSALIERIQRTLSWQRGNYLRAEFGTANKALNVRYSDVEGGARLRWITSDEVMLDSLKEWAVSVAAVRPTWATNPTP